MTTTSTVENEFDIVSGFGYPIQFGKIYKVSGNGRVYIGSTRLNDLNVRLARHRTDYEKNTATNYKTTKCFLCFGGPEPPVIELLDVVKFREIKELCKRESEYIKQFPECVNKAMPFRTEEEKVTLRKESRNASATNDYQVARRVPGKCECGGSCSDKSRSQHVKSKKHQTWVQSNPVII